MKHFLLIVILAFSQIGFSQGNKCNCLVKLTEREFKLRTTLKSYGAEDYYKIKPKTGQKFSTHVVIKDSAGLWYIKPYIKEEAGAKIVTVKKSAQILCLVVQFNSLDSIPLYSEANKDSKILKYIRKAKYPTTTSDVINGFDANDHWFAGCGSDFVKINVGGSISGWIKKENYLQN